MKKAIALIRVSTDKQGKSGLGLEAQAADIARFNEAEGFELIETFVEVESGKFADAIDKRPQLAAALALAKKMKATLVVAKLDRLTRNVEFGAGLLNRGVQFRIADMPSADNFQIHIMLAVAEKEREMISRRTKAALAAAQARGVQLGCPDKSINAGRQDEAQAFAETLREVVEPLACRSIRQVAAELNARGIVTRTGGKWSLENTRLMINRLNLKEAA
jgi:DNA invertase Pin-like site-specific DNA recombinase